MTVAPGFEPVADEFRRNFSERGELGAAFAVMRGPELVVDLWGGVADRRAGRLWDADTLQLIFSGSKGLVAVCLLVLIDRGRLGLEDRVATHWPEFAAAGKEEVTVRELVTHTAGLPGLAAPLEILDLTDDRKMAAALAAQSRFEDPRAFAAYHPLTFGWLCGELVRRVDGRSVGRFFAEEIAGPLDLEIYVGLPERLEPRVSRLELDEGFGEALQTRPGDEDDPLMWAAWMNPPVWAADTFPWNLPAYHRAQIPAAGAIASARSVAKLYASLERLLSPATLELGTTELERRTDPLLAEPQAFGVCFALQTETRPLGPPPDAFGHPGAGGSIHGCWPSQGIAFSYSMNLMREEAEDERGPALLDALFRCTESEGRPGPGPAPV